MGIYVDQFSSTEGWKYTEDISFFTTASLNITAQGVVQKVPITFSLSPLTSFNRVPSAATFFLFLRKLDICCQNPLPYRTPLWVWNQAIDTTLVIPNGSGQSFTQFFVSTPSPTGLIAIDTPVCIRRLQFDTIPANVTFTSVDVKPDWALSFDRLHTNTAIASNTEIDMCAFYDNTLGLVNENVTPGQATQIIVRYNVNNTSGASQNVNVQIYGMQQAYQWAQWLIQYEAPSGGAVFDIGQYDDCQTPVKQFVLDKMIPITQMDTGITTIGNLVFTANQQLGFYLSQSTYDIMLTATLAYLIPG